MIESEHDNLTPDKGRARPARTNEILDTIVHGGTPYPARAPSRGFSLPPGESGIIRMEARGFSFGDRQ